MISYINDHKDMGRMLWLEQDDVQIGIALDYGIRVRHLSIKGMENLYYEQPSDLSDGFSTPSGWKLRGGHRLWMAPECDESYCPDDTPVSYTLKEDGVVIVQDTEPWLKIQKTLEITFRPDGTVHLIHHFYNRNDHPITGASWGVNSLDGCGKIWVDFAAGQREYKPRRLVSLWGATNLSDPRLKILKNEILAEYQPITDYFKIGVYSPGGKAILESKGQKLTMEFAAPPSNTLPDNGCNFELFMAKAFLEMETLGSIAQIAPGESVSHWETWKLERL